MGDGHGLRLQRDSPRIHPGWLPHTVRHDGDVPLYFEAAAVITTLVLLGQVLELRARRATSSAIRALLGLAPDRAGASTDDGSERDVALDDVRRRPAARAPWREGPVDGECSRASTVDESMMHGRADAGRKVPGRRVTGATVNGTGRLRDARRSAVGEGRCSRRSCAWSARRSAAARRSSGSPTSSRLVRARGARRRGRAAIVLGALGASAAARARAGQRRRRPDHRLPVRARARDPISIMVGTGRGAREGVLVRDAEALEALARVDTLVLDKTGT
jgi:Cu+-exporting ATPase